MPFESLLLKQCCGHRRVVVPSAVPWLNEGVWAPATNLRKPYTPPCPATGVDPDLPVWILWSSVFTALGAIIQTYMSASLNTWTKCSVLSSPQKRELH